MMKIIRLRIKSDRNVIIEKIGTVVECNRDRKGSTWKDGG